MFDQLSELSHCRKICAAPAAFDVFVIRRDGRINNRL